LGKDRGRHQTHRLSSAWFSGGIYCDCCPEQRRFYNARSFNLHGGHITLVLDCSYGRAGNEVVFQRVGGYGLASAGADVSRNVVLSSLGVDLFAILSLTFKPAFLIEGIGLVKHCYSIFGYYYGVSKARRRQLHKILTGW
jgi:hypothetical protein